ncbi:hypothetical protein IQ259_09185 [Fortiea sp. LEGE XX443]|uniref:hypothetical protein n=1 Tax=Fortiea sp. LEGE XX443 TaxID=1828611 RepID=UPI001880572F|nr:hypothetical protein [Fortiea sp. LEGE XX443]MBE9005212.1 hypothetical protein [Fortiea sp. LEGE XX443]
MKLRLLSIFAAFVLMFCIFSPPSFAVATQCQIHKNSEWRCAKDNYKSDNIKIGNRIQEEVSFKVGKWRSNCGQNGSNYYDESFSLAPGKSTPIYFEDAVANECKELFVHNCSPDSCTNILTVNPS